MTDLDTQFLDREQQVKAVRSLIERATSLTQVEKVLLMLAQHSEGRLVAIDPSNDFRDVDIRQIATPLSQGVSGQVFRTGRSEVIADTSLDSREDVAMLRKLGARNLLTVPIVYRRRDPDGEIISETTIGVLHAMNKRQGEFDGHDQQILYILGSQASQLIAHTDLYPVAIRDMEQYHNTIASMGVGVAAISAEGRIYEANSEMKVLGLRQQDVGRHYREIFTKGTQFLAEIIDGVFRTKKSAGTELPIHTQNGEGKEEQRTFRIQVDPIITQTSHQGNGFAGVVVVLQDMTVVREEEQMQDSFVSLISHDLRTPLTVIQGFVDTMLMAIEDGMPFDQETTKEFLTMVLHQSRRMLRLVNDVLVLARLSKGLSLELTLRPFDLVQSIKMVVESQRSITSEFEFIVEAPDDLPEVVADQERIEQVVANLLSNAAKYSPEGGTITVRIVREGDYVTVSVSDQGIGIPEAALSKMFGRLFRVESEKHKGIKGTGLGLYLCKHLIELHGGTIGVTSKYQGDYPDDHGSTFYFTIPIQGPHSQA